MAQDNTNENIVEEKIEKVEPVLAKTVATPKVDVTDEILMNYEKNKKFKNLIKEEVGESLTKQFSDEEYGETAKDMRKGVIDKIHQFVASNPKQAIVDAKISKGVIEWAIKSEKAELKTRNPELDIELSLKNLPAERRADILRKWQTKSVEDLEKIEKEIKKPEAKPTPLNKETTGNTRETTEAEKAIVRAPEGENETFPQKLARKYSEAAKLAKDENRQPPHVLDFYKKLREEENSKK